VTVGSYRLALSLYSNSPDLREAGVRGKASDNIKIEVGHWGNGFWTWGENNLSILPD